MLRTLTALSALLLAAPAAAQVALFDPEDYGQAQLIVRQSTGDASAFIAASEGGAFEPIFELSDTDRMAILARPVGRVDVLLRDTQTGEEGATTCTGSLLGDGLLLTNEHCMRTDGSLEIVAASVVMNYHALDGSGSERFEVGTQPVEILADLDYVILRVDPDAEARFGHVAIGAAPADQGTTRVVIHHPLGRPKVMSRFRCFTLDRAGPPIVAHRCDTLPGSSGSLLFDDRGIAVALHRGGGLEEADPSSFNMAIDLGVILQASGILGDTPAAQQPSDPAGTTTQTPDGPLSTQQMNDILTGE